MIALKVKQTLQKLRPTRRKLIQLYFALLFNVNFRGFITGRIYRGNSKIFCAPGLNCYSCPGAVGACPLGAFQGSFSAGRSTLFYVCGILALYGVLFGRWICGWLCPFGWIQELLHKLPTPKLPKGPATKILSWLKYGILLLFVGVVPIAYAIRDIPLPPFCKYICPAGTLEGGLTLLSNKVNAGYFSKLGPLFTWKFLLMVSILTGSVFIFRLFCRFLCPLGALYGLFNRFSFFGIHVDKAKCIDCNRCVGSCGMDIHRPGDAECISCGECIGSCPTNAIQWKGPGILIRKNEGAVSSSSSGKKARHPRRVTAVLMLLFLIFAAICCWDTDGTAVGKDLGDLCFSAQLQLIDSTGIREETLDPANTGRVTVINFWGTWCAPCVEELPDFDRIATEYADRVTVVAVHTSMGNTAAPPFLGSYYPDSRILFASDYVLPDSTVEQYYTALGGRGTYPYTVILDAQGIIRGIYVEPLAYSELKQILDKLL